MKTKNYSIIVVLLCLAMQLSAQTVGVPDKEIVGVWIMESFQYEGEKTVVCGMGTNYIEVKYYGADGEYASACVIRNYDGSFGVVPQEYGTYSFKNGVYKEMGRAGYVKLIDANTYKGRWKNRHDIWRKKVVPERLRKYIVDCCKVKDTPKDVQQMIQKIVFEE